MYITLKHIYRNRFSHFPSDPCHVTHQQGIGRVHAEINQLGEVPGRQGQGHDSNVGMCSLSMIIYVFIGLSIPIIEEISMFF